MDPATQHAIREIGQQLARLTQQVQVLQRGARTTQLDGATIDAGTLSFTDTDGNVAHVIGLQPDGSVTSVAQNVNPPSVAPSAPIVAGVGSGITVSWDGNTADGSVWPADLQGVQINVSTTNGFTPSASTIIGILSQAGTYPIGNLTIGTTYYVVLVALNTSGLASPPSAQASGVPTGALLAPGSVVQAALAAGLGLGGNLAENSYFAGGDTTGWTPFNGTLATTQSPPGTIPFGAGGWAAQFLSSNASNALEGVPGKFPVTTSTQYLISCWVNAPSGTNNVQIGFDWLLSGAYVSTSTVSVNGTGNWQQYTVTITSPSSGINQAYPRIGSVASGVTLYVWGVIVLPQVPGSLIQAGTITATQIAAQTITAALIAANTITAAQIASGTITATQLSAGIIYAGIVDGTMIKAAQYVADGTTGEFLAYTGTPAHGNLLASISPSSGSDAFTNAYIDGFGIYDAAAKIQMHVNATFGAPALELYTGLASEFQQASLYNLGANVGLVNEFENVFLQGPSSTFDHNSCAVVLSDSAHDGSTVAAGFLKYNNSNLFYWDSFGLHALVTLFGTGGVLTIGDAIKLATAGVISQRSALSGYVPITQVSVAYIGPISPTSGFTAITSVWSIPANDATQGTVYEIHAWGTGTWPSPAQPLFFQISAFGGPVCQCNIGGVEFVAGQSFLWDMVATIIVGQTTGTTIVSGKISGDVGVSGANQDTTNGTSQSAGGFVGVGQSSPATSAFTSNSSMTLQAKFTSSTTQGAIVSNGSTFTRIGP